MEKSLASTIREANTKLIANGDLDAVGDFFTSDYRVNLTRRVLKGGHNLVHEFVTGLRQSFAEIQVDVDILMEGETRVAWQRTLRGTHNGKFKGFPASGVEIIWRDMVISQFRDELMEEDWVITDLAEQLLLARKRKL
jgi:predicted ester cyclase